VSQTDWTGPGLNAENWREIVRSKVEAMPFDAALEDVRPFLASSEEIELLYKGNLLHLLQ
jgi:hypothetical protein